jgi:hypothetical protein
MKGTTVLDRMTYSENAYDYYKESRPPMEPVARKPPLREPFREVPTPQHESRNSFAKSDTYDYTQQYTMDDDDKFELMNVTIVVYGLSGIVCEKEVAKKKRSKFGLGKDKSSKISEKFGNSISTKAYSGSTISSVGVSASDEGTFIEKSNAPTTAVVSYRKNAFSSQTSLETFLPSLPMHHPTSLLGSKFRYGASWPSEQSTLTRDEASIERSSFKLTRCMKQGMFVAGVGAGSNYVHETLELRINLSRGTELIRLGTASLVISGEEEGEVQINVPLKPIVHKSKKTHISRFKGKAKAKSNKYGYFCNDPSRRYFLDDNATLRVGIQVIPEHAMRLAEEREKKENDLRKMLGSNDLKQAIGGLGGKNAERHRVPFQHFAFMDVLPDMDQRGRERELSPQSIFPNFLCGAMGLCIPDSMAPEPKASSLPVEMIHTTNDMVDFGVASLISSVSESTDGSEYSEGEIEAHINNFRSSTAFH